jgi:putative ABC transport system permease protein
MLKAALRDLQWRYKRVAITVLGTALVFSMSLLMSGLANSFVVEVDRTLDHQRADYWVANAGDFGPFSGGFAITRETVNALAASPGVLRADPVLTGRISAPVNGVVLQFNLFGVVPGGLGSPKDLIGSQGSTTPQPGTVIVPAKLGLSIGDSLMLGTTPFTVSGVLEKASLYAGQLTILVTLEDAQKLILGGYDRSSMVLLSTKNAAPLQTVPAGLKQFSRSETQTDLLRPLINATQSLTLIKFLLWAVAGLIVGSVVYLTTLERTRDLAVFKATGVSTISIGSGICLQAVIVAVVASFVGILIALILAPNFPMDVSISSGSMLSLPGLAVFVGVLAGLIGVRKTTRIDPAAAFGGP